MLVGNQPIDGVAIQPQKGAEKKKDRTLVCAH